MLIVFAKPVHATFRTRPLNTTRHISHIYPMHAQDLYVAKGGESYACYILLLADVRGTERSEAGRGAFSAIGAKLVKQGGRQLDF